MARRAAGAAAGARGWLPRRWPLGQLLRPPLLRLVPLAALARAAGGGPQAEGAAVELPEVLAELRALRAEQAELRERLDRCRCAVPRRTGEAGDGGAVHGAAVEGERGANVGADRASAADLEDLDGTGEVVRVDVQNVGWMKEVLFGGAPWVFHCTDRQASVPDEPPPVFFESAQDLKSMASFGLLDCWERMPSGKTLAHRFDFPKPPVTFAVANGDPPALLDLQGVVKPWQVKRKVGQYLGASVERIDGPERFKQYCTSRRACLVVGFKTAPALANALQTLPPLLEQRRGVRAVSVDTSVWKVKMEAKHAGKKKKMKDKSPGDRADVLCLGRPGGSSAARGAFFRPGGGSGAQTLDEFVRRCGDGRGLSELAKTPQLTLRPPEAPKYVSPSAGSDASPKSPKKAQGQAGRRGAPDAAAAKGRRPRAGRPKKPPPQASRGGRTDVVGSRQQLEEDEEPPVVALDDDEAEAMERAAEEEMDIGWEEVEL